MVKLQVDKSIKRSNFVKTKIIKGMTKKEKKQAKEKIKVEVKEFEFNKATDLIPKKNNRLTCIILSEDRGTYFVYRKFDSKNDSFHFNKGLYIIDNQAIYISKNGNRYSVYLEGISLPIKLTMIEKYEEEIEYVDLDGTTQKTLVQKIKGLKYDSKILEIFTDRKLAENFTKIKEERYQIYILIFGIINTVMLGILMGLVYYFR